MSKAILLEGNLSTANAEELRRRLSSSGDHIIIDGTAVRSIGALCALEIMRAHRFITSRNGRVAIKASKQMSEDLHLLGLSKLVGAAEESHD